MNPQPPILTYAGPTSQLGVVIDSGPAGTRVIVPRLRGWRMIFNKGSAAAAFFGVGTIVFISVISTEGWEAVMSGPRWIPLFPIMFVWILGYQLYTMWRRRIFLVAADEVCYGFLIGTREFWERRWPRRDIGEIKLNPYSGRLLIRVTGKDMEEYFVSANPRVTGEIAAALNNTLQSFKPGV